MPEFPAGEVWHEDEPDFLIHTEDGVLGVEHRQLFKPPGESKLLLQAMESQIDYIVAQAQEHAELRGTPPAHVSLFLNVHQSLEKRQRLNMARQLANFMHDILIQENAPISFEIGAGSRAEKPEFLDHAFVRRDEHLNKHLWDCPEAGWAVRDSRAILQEAINDKASNIERYLSNCSRCWLLLASDGRKPSNFIHADNATREHIYSSPFERTYFLDCGHGDLVLLNTKNS